MLKIYVSLSNMIDGAGVDPIILPDNLRWRGALGDLDDKIFNRKELSEWVKNEVDNGSPNNVLILAFVLLEMDKWEEHPDRFKHSYWIEPCAYFLEEY